MRAAANGLTNVAIEAMQPARFEQVLEPDRFRTFLRGARRARELLAGRVVWNVNSTALGGGVAEMLRSLLAYVRGAGVDARWLVIGGEPDFFAVTKRIHNHLHGFPGDGGSLGLDEQAAYGAVTERNAAALTELIRPGDVVILHDPQTAGLCGPVRDTGARVVWRCHVGLDRPNELARRAWDFLREQVRPADRYVFSRRAHFWEGLDESRMFIVPPSIDAFSPKNQDLTPQQVQAIIAVTGLMAEEPAGDATFTREDGSPGNVRRAADLSAGAPAAPPGVPLVVQVSRWDRLKDPAGVIAGFVEHVPASTGAHLVVAGPSVAAVTDDPEGAGVLRDAAALWGSLPPGDRERVHLASLPMDDGEENAAIVNALQRRADIVVQKSLAEGFGLTVAEAMWKARPVVASRIGGIQDQVVDGESGLLVDDPTDLRAFGGAVARLLDDRPLAERLGQEARRRVVRDFLGPRHLMQYLDLVTQLLNGDAAAGG